MMFLLLSGMVIGAGVFLVGLGLRPQTQALSKMMVDLEQPSGASLSGGAAIRSSIFSAISGSANDSLRQDLNLLGRTHADHARSKIQNAAILSGFCLLFLFTFSSILAAALSPAIWILAISASATIGWVLTNRLTHTRAEEKRKEFRSSLSLYLSLVSTMLAGGSGIEEALYQVTRFGTSEGFRELESALIAARTRDLSPWVVFSEVAEAKGLLQLDELATSMEIAGVEGAKIRETLMTKAKSLRHLELVDLQTQAGAASESMGLPVGVMMIGFIVLVGYPAFKALISI